MTKKKKAKPLRIFYSWQSDLPSDTNLNAIRNGLRKAVKRLQAEYPDRELIADEAMRGAMGASKISDKVIEKLDQADLIVADITSVTPPGAERPCPNPNVTFELGYGVAQVGWERVILLYNTAFGDFPNDLPFDFRQNRTMTFEFRPGPSADARATFVDNLRGALKAIIAGNPKRPAETRGVPAGRIIHDRDVSNMRRLMSSLHLPTVDEFIEEMPNRIHGRTLWYWEGFHALMEDSLFALHDEELKGAVNEFHDAWRRALSHSNHFDSSANISIYTFTWPRTLAERAEAQASWDDILDARNAMRAALNRILARLRADYLEVDIASTNRSAHKAFAIDHEERVERRKKAARAHKKKKK